MASKVGNQPLPTKILPPRRGQGLIDRPRLIEEAGQLAGKQVSLIKAGHGYGKTSLAVAWVERLRQDGSSVAWLSLDADDDEPARFLFYLSHALHRADERIGGAAVEFVSDISLLSFGTVIASLINDLADCDNDVFLFLDDYQKIADPEIQDAVSYLLRYAPGQFHLILIAVGDVALPLARLRANNQLLEFGTSSLRFDLEETRKFLEQEKIAGLEAAGIRLLHAKTEGWPAILRIVATTLRQPEQDFQRYVAALSGAFRPVDGYLAELLAALPRDMVTFMRRIAILESFSAPLCQAVTACRNSRDLLDAMDAGQVLLIPLDEDKRWYRFHPLLREHLQEQLAGAYGDELPRLHRRAYRWYALNEFWTEAIRQAIATGDTEQAIVWVERCAMDLVKQGDLLTLLGWQRVFPTELMRSQIKVRLAIAWGFALAMRFDEALELVEAVRKEAIDVEAPGAPLLFCESDTITAVVAALRDDTAAALPIAELSIERSNDPWTANVASNVILFCRWKAADFERCYDVPWIPYSADGDRLNLFASVYRRCLQGMVEFQQLRLSVAERCCLDAVSLAKRYGRPNSAAAALGASVFARVLYEQGKFDEAEALIADRFDVIDASGLLDCVLNAYFVQIGIANRRRHFERVFSLLEKLESLGHLRGWGRVVGAVLLVRVRLSVTEGRLAETTANVNRLERLAKEFEVPARCAWSEIRLFVFQARAWLASAESRPADAAAIWRALRTEAEAVGDRYSALCASLRLAEALLASDQPEEAEQVFRAALRTAASAGLHQTVLDNATDLNELLLRVRDNAERDGEADDLSAYVASLVAVPQEIDSDRPDVQPGPEIVGELSSRELNILDFIGLGHSNKEIGRELGISPETVKSHVKNILAKLVVDRRAHAVSRARNLGLIASV